MVSEMKWQIALLLAWRRRVSEKLWWRLAWAIPDKLVYFATIRLVAYATQGEYSNTVAPDLGAMDAISRYSKDRWGSS